MNYIGTLITTAIVIFLIDIFWLMTGGVYASKMTEKIQGSPLKMRYMSAVIVYVFLAYMLLETTSYRQAFMYGVSIYAVYDFTNHALLDKYDWKFAIADSIWGGILFILARKALKTFF